MVQSVLAAAVRKLTHAGEQVGFSVELMIELLNAGWSVQNLVQFIELGPSNHGVADNGSSRWVM